MERKRTNLFQVNGNPMPVPDADVEIGYRDIYAEAGEDEAGFRHPVLLRKKIGTWTFSYSYIGKSDMEYLEGIFPDTPTFQFTHPDRKQPGELVTSICERVDLSTVWHNGPKMLWRNVKFAITEC